MPVVRAKVAEIMASVSASYAAEATAAAGGNNVISKAERGAMAPGLLKDAADGIGARVLPSDAAAFATQAVQGFVDANNQTSGAGRAYLSKDEIRAVFAQNAEAGGRVARAWELITGKTIDVPGGPYGVPPVVVAPNDPPVVVDPPADPGSGAHDVRGAIVDGQLVVAVDGGALTIDATHVAINARALTLDVGGTPVVVPLPDGGTNPRGVVEAIRAALPDHDLLVEDGSDVKKMTVRLYGKGEAPHPDAFPVYAHFLSPMSTPGTDQNFVRRIHGTKSFELFASLWDTTQPIRLVVDDRVYEVTAGGSIADGTDAAYALKRMLEADGVDLDFRNYGNVIKFKLL